MKEELINKMLNSEIGIDKVLEHLEEEAKRNLAASEKRRTERNAAIASITAVAAIHLSVSGLLYLFVSFIWVSGMGNSFRWWMPKAFVVILLINIFIAAMNYIDGWDA